MTCFLLQVIPFLNFTIAFAEEKIIPEDFLVMIPNIHAVYFEQVPTTDLADKSLKRTAEKNFLQDPTPLHDKNSKKSRNKRKVLQYYKEYI
jgi:hypothetical protein